jgi:hypothetical protein
MHPFSPRGKLSWKGLESFDASLNMIKSCQQSLNEPILIENSHIIRLCFVGDNDFYLKQTSQSYPEASFTLISQYE